MRRSELVVTAKRERIDLAHGVIYLDDTKNGQRRAVPLTPWALAWLKHYLVGKPSRGRIFSISPSSATRAFARARKRARRDYEALCARYGRVPKPEYFADLRLHDLRHEATTRLAEVYDMHKLAKVTGHRDTRMLLRYYHPSGETWPRSLPAATSAGGSVPAWRQASHQPCWISVHVPAEYHQLTPLAPAPTPTVYVMSVDSMGKAANRARMAGWSFKVTIAFFQFAQHGRESLILLPAELHPIALGLPIRRIHEEKCAAGHNGGCTQTRANSRYRRWPGASVRRRGFPQCAAS